MVIKNTAWHAVQYIIFLPLVRFKRLVTLETSLSCFYFFRSSSQFGNSFWSRRTCRASTTQKSKGKFLKYFKWQCAANRISYCAIVMHTHEYIHVHALIFGYLRFVCMWGCCSSIDSWLMWKWLKVECAKAQQNEDAKRTTHFKTEEHFIKIKWQCVYVVDIAAALWSVTRVQWPIQFFLSIIFVLLLRKFLAFIATLLLFLWLLWRPKQKRKSTQIVFFSEKNELTLLNLMTTCESWIDNEIPSKPVSKGQITD